MFSQNVDYWSVSISSSCCTIIPAFWYQRRSTSRDDPTLSTVTLQITQLCCLWCCSLELSTSSHSRLIFIILLLQPSQNWVTI